MKVAEQLKVLRRAVVGIYVLKNHDYREVYWGRTSYVPASVEGLFVSWMTVEQVNYEPVYKIFATETEEVE